MIKPMLACPSTGTAGRKAVDLGTLVGTHSFDLKLDGLRAILYWDGTQLTIRNRSLVDITAQFPELEAAAPALWKQPITLDGEIVALDGTFTTVATRGKTTKPHDVARLVQTKPCSFVAFDVLSMGGTDLMPLPWTARRDALVKVGESWPEPFCVSECSDDAVTMWNAVSTIGLEGVIAKRKNAPYIPGQRSPHWLKFKTVRRVTCIAVGYEPGEGSRAHFGAMHIAMIGDSGPVPVGRVGTGFTDAETRELRKRLDAGDLFLVEIEALNRTAAGVLRFPVYKGVRTDLDVLTGAPLSQLDTLPLC